MSLVMQIIQAVTATEREIDDQMSKLTSYNAKVDEVMRRVQAELGGSTQNYVQEMKDRGVRSIIKYGIAFSGKRVGIKTAWN